ncbi:hypothetical protein XA68_13743 [Ophiocordyceps unilateralis]|uniref:Cytochrome c oxidase subunit n=1 Tax=Ophiocordyceps unilateralis TaxID=268505 RepID=A0A2A9PAD9_OPHUN|nr:hypothetical protein XA68_13743 [Ophiocordyceps unilateralis]
MNFAPSRHRLDVKWCGPLRGRLAQSRGASNGALPHPSSTPEAPIILPQSTPDIIEPNPIRTSSQPPTSKTIAMSAARAASRFTVQLRNASQRRLASSVTNNKFIKERQHIKAHAERTVEMWKKLSIYAVIPSLALSGANAYYLWNQHWEHWSHMPPLEERVEYPYQNIRTKNFPWGDGDKTLFWNSEVNYHNKDKVA